MSDALRLALALLVAAGVTSLLTPIAISLARATSFLDRPVGYKGHERSTPYLGGLALVGGVLAGGVFGWFSESLVAVAIWALALLALGTVDDRLNLDPKLRLAVEVAVAAGLYAAGVGWSIFSAELPNLLFSVLFVVGVVNAYNLMDNMDGAACAVAAGAAAVLGLWAAAQGDPWLGAMLAAVVGSCIGFLRFNLARPSRIFLGDGGSMPLGFLIAAGIMSLPGADGSSWALAPVAVVLVGLPALDTTLVVVSRVRRETPVFTGARDHLTHRLRPRLRTARRVAALLACVQAALCGVGVYLLDRNPSLAAAGALVLIAAGLATVAVLESAGWAPTAGELSN